MPISQRDRRAARRAGAGLVGIERIAGRPVDRIDRIGAGTELRGVGLADHDRAGPAHRRDLALVGLGHEVGELGRAEGGAQAFGQRQILDPDRQAEERPERLARHDRAFRRPRLGLGAVPAGGDERVHGAIDPQGPRPARRQELDRRDPLGADQPAQLERAQVAEVGHPGTLPGCIPRPAVRHRGHAGAGGHRRRRAGRRASRREPAPAGLRRRDYPARRGTASALSAPAAVERLSQRRDGAGADSSQIRRLLREAPHRPAPRRARRTHSPARASGRLRGRSAAANTTPWRSAPARPPAPCPCRGSICPACSICARSRTRTRSRLRSGPGHGR